MGSVRMRRWRTLDPQTQIAEQKPLTTDGSAFFRHAEGLND